MTDWLDVFCRLATVAPDVLRQSLRIGGLAWRRNLELSKSMLRLAFPELEEESDVDLPRAILVGDDPGFVLFTDDPMSSRRDAVFPVHPESLFLAGLIPGGSRDQDFLDVGTGSGILAIRAAHLGWNSLALDLSKRALRCAQVNALINGVPIKTIEADIGCGAVMQEKVKLCLANLPFEPSPSGGLNYLHSDGGEDGSTTTRAFLSVVDKILAPDGRAYVLSFSMLSGGESILRESLRELGATRQTCRVQLSDKLPIKHFAPRYSKDAWRRLRESLENKGMVEFVIELLCIGSRVERRTECQEVTLRRADPSWLYPLGQKELGRVKVMD